MATITKDISQTCLNCKYFSQYYVINSTLRFTSTGKGFCGNVKINYKSAERYLKMKCACDLWQPRELKKMKEHYSMELRLQMIEELLSDIIALLKYEEYGN